MSGRTKLPEVVFPENRISNELSFYHYGKHACLPSNSYGPSERDYYLFHFVTKGKGVYKCNNKIWHIEENQGFLIRPHEETFYQADEKDPWMYYFVAFHGTLAEKIVDTINWIDGYVINPENPLAIKRIMKAICASKDYSVGGGYEYAVIGNIYLLFAELAKNGVLTRSLKPESEKLNILNVAIDYIHNNYASELSVAEIADRVNVHRSNLYRLFKEQLGISAIKYVQNYRMDKSVYYIINTDMPICEVAENVGINDYPHFCKQFKKYYGFTPTDYRKRFSKEKEGNNPK